MASCHDPVWARQLPWEPAEPHQPLDFERFRLLLQQLQLFRFLAEERRVALRLPDPGEREANYPLC